MLTKTPQKQSLEIYLALKSILIERTQFDKFLISLKRICRERDRE